MGNGYTVTFGSYCKLRTGVETEPSEPEDEHTQGSQSEAVAGNGAALAFLVILAETWAECNCAYESQYTTNGVNDGRSGEVVECGTEGLHHERVFSSVHEPAATPCPVTLNGVDEQ